MGRGSGSTNFLEAVERMSANEKTWVLSVPFVVSPPMEFDGETVDTFGDVRLTIRPAGGGFNLFLFEGLRTIEEAQQQFSALQTGVLTASIYLRGGVRIMEGLLEVDGSTQLPSDPAQPMTYPEGRDLSRVTLQIGQVSFVTDRVLPRFLEGLRVGLTAPKPSIAMQDRSVQLARTLFIDSYFERSPQARLLGLIGVLEVLKDKGSRSSEAQALIDRWMDEVGKDVPEEVALRQQLADLKRISINHGIRSLVRRHLGDSEAARAGKLYNYRSKLVHNGVVTADIEDVASLSPSLRVAAVGGSGT
jgi:hypothetical protein